MRKFDVRAAAGVSPLSTSSGVRLFAASATAVIAFVRPGPWCTLQTPTRPLTRAQPSAIITAPHSWRAATKRAPPRRSAFVTTRLPLPIRPKTWLTPSAASCSPTASATVRVGVGRGLMAGIVSERSAHRGRACATFGAVAVRPASARTLRGASRAGARRSTIVAASRYSRRPSCSASPSSERIRRCLSKPSCWSAPRSGCIAAARSSGSSSWPSRWRTSSRPLGSGPLWTAVAVPRRPAGVLLAPPSRRHVRADPSQPAKPDLASRPCRQVRASSVVGVVLGLLGVLRAARARPRQRRPRARARRQAATARAVRRNDADIRPLDAADGVTAWRKRPRRAVDLRRSLRATRVEARGSRQRQAAARAARRRALGLRRPAGAQPDAVSPRRAARRARSWRRPRWSGLARAPAPAPCCSATRATRRRRRRGARRHLRGDAGALEEAQRELGGDAVRCCPRRRRRLGAGSA